MDIVNISHSDVDGSVSAILIKEYARSINVKCETFKATYKTINDVFNDVYDSKKLIIITDIAPNNIDSKYENVSNVFVIDHHKPKMNFKNKKIEIGEDISSSKLVYDFFLKKANYNEKFKKLMLYAHDFDTFTNKFVAAKALNYLYYFYYFERFVDRFKDGFDGFTEDEKIFLNCKVSQVKNALTNIEVCAINDDIAFVVSEDFIGEVCEEVFRRGFKYLFINSPFRKNLSMRSKKDTPIHCGEFLEFFNGGGHRYAGGVDIKSVDEIAKILDGFKIVYEEYHI